MVAAPVPHPRQQVIPPVRQSDGCWSVVHTGLAFGIPSWAVAGAGSADEPSSRSASRLPSFLSGGGQRVVHPASVLGVPPVHNQARPLQDGHVVGDGALLHIQGLGEVADALLALAQQADDLQSAGIGQGLQGREKARRRCPPRESGLRSAGQGMWLTSRDESSQSIY